MIIRGCKYVPTRCSALPRPSFDLEHGKARMDSWRSASASSRPCTQSSLLVGPASPLRGDALTRGQRRSSGVRRSPRHALHVTATLAPDLDELQHPWVQRPVRQLRQARAGSWVWRKAHPGSLKLRFNQTVVAVASAAALLKLATVDVGTSEAAHWSLWQYLQHMPRDNLETYTAAARASPVATKALTSAVAYALGDFLTQVLQADGGARGGAPGGRLQRVCMLRVLRSSVAGLCIHGPLCHLWIQFIDHYLYFDGAWWNTGVKVLADQTAWSLFLNSMYTSAVLGMQGRSLPSIQAEIAHTWYPAISAGWKFWPFVHCVTFGGLIPQELKILFIDVVEVLWVMILSAVVNRDTAPSLPPLETTEPSQQPPLPPPS